MKKYIIDTGNEIAVHGELHRAPGKQRPIEGIKDVLNCRIKLEQLFGTIIRGMAYPDSGIHDFQNNANYECVREYLKDLGIAYARSLCGDNDGFKLLLIGTTGFRRHITTIKIFSHILTNSTTGYLLTTPIFHTASLGSSTCGVTVLSFATPITGIIWKIFTKSSPGKMMCGMPLILRFMIM